MSNLSDYPALRKPRLKAGVGAKTATMIWLAGVIILLILGVPWGLLGLALGAMAHLGLRWLYEKDHRILSVYSTHAVVPNTLHAGSPSHGTSSVSRPRGYAQNLPLH